MCEIFLSICSNSRRTTLPRAAFVHNKSPGKTQQMWRVGAPRPALFTQDLDSEEDSQNSWIASALKQPRKHLGLSDPLGRENKYLEERNFCGISPESKDPGVALAREGTGPWRVRDAAGSWGHDHWWLF